MSEQKQALEEAYENGFMEGRRKGYLSGYNDAHFDMEHLVLRDRPKVAGSFCNGIGTSFCKQCGRGKNRWAFCPVLGQRLDWRK